MTHSVAPSEERCNLVQIFLSRAKQFGSRAALGRKEDQRYVDISWQEWSESVKQTALGLFALGVRAGDRAAILSENRPEWTYADLGTLSLGAIVVPIYPTSSLQDISYILENAGAGVLFVSNALPLEKIKGIFDQNPRLRKVILFERPSGNFDDRILSFETLVEMGRRENLNNEGFYDSLVSGVSCDAVATIIYTSGTTGPPKGVMLTHHNFVANCIGAQERIAVDEEEVAISFLPLSHVFERMAGYYFMTFHGATIAYAESMQTVAEDMVLVRPTIAAAVPRFYEKVYAKILDQIESGPALRKKLFYWAIGVGRRVGERRVRKQGVPLGLSLQYVLAQALVFQKLKKKLGGRIRFFISGGAPLSESLAWFFYAAGILILEGYGLSETSPVIAVNSPDAFKFGTVGQPLPNVEVKIADDGEILTRGPCVMKGYYQNEKATQEAMEGGWFHTGDIGVLDEEGFLKITDRKKDIIATSGGKKVSPQNIENLLLADPFFSQVVLIGDKRNYLVALIVPNASELKRHAREVGLENLSWPELLKDPSISAWVESRIWEKTKDLAPYEQIKCFALLGEELTQEKGDLTPTLKVRRKIVMEKYAGLIEELYRKGSRAEAVLKNSPPENSGL